MRHRRPLAAAAPASGLALGLALTLAAGLGGCAASGPSVAYTPLASSATPQYRLYAGDAVGRMLNAPRFEDDLGDSRFAETNARSSIVITGVQTD